PAKHRVRVAIDQTWRYPRAIEVHTLEVALLGQRIKRPDPDDLRAVGHDGSVFDNRVAAVCHGCCVTVVPERFHQYLQSSVLPRVSRIADLHCGSELAHECVGKSAKSL
nr:hypothetical protein [Tanacetum cinerariifolium]